MIILSSPVFWIFGVYWIKASPHSHGPQEHKYLKIRNKVKEHVVGSTGTAISLWAVVSWK